MKIYFIPKTKWGKWSAGLLGGFFLSFLLMNFLVALGQRGGETFFDNLALSIPGILGALFVIGAFFSGIYSIFKRQERSVLVFLASLIGFVILFFLIGDIYNTSLRKTEK